MIFSYFPKTPCPPVQLFGQTRAVYKLAFYFTVKASILLTLPTLLKALISMVRASNLATLLTAA
jgi:hypothetical protein